MHLIGLHLTGLLLMGGMYLACRRISQAVLIGAYDTSVHLRRRRTFIPIEQTTRPVEVLCNIRWVFGYPRMDRCLASSHYRVTGPKDNVSRNSNSEVLEQRGRCIAWRCLKIINYSNLGEGFEHRLNDLGFLEQIIPPKPLLQYQRSWP
jgi:hypothetical protein